jgi:hypothetical protein
MSPQWIDSEQHASLQAPPRARYHVQTDITLPPVVHGPILISFADLNGFEFGARVRNPYRSLFVRQPDDVIANGSPSSAETSPCPRPRHSNMSI